MMMIIILGNNINGIVIKFNVDKGVMIIKHQ